MDFAASRIRDVWADVPDGVDAETLAQNIVAAQEFAWIARGFPVAEHREPPSDAQAKLARIADFIERAGLTSVYGRLTPDEARELNQILNDKEAD